MAELCLVASHGYPSGIGFQQEPGLNRVYKDCPSFIPTIGLEQDLLKSCSLSLRLHARDDSWEPISGVPNRNQFVSIDSINKTHVIGYLEEIHSASVLFSLGIAERCARHEKILKFLTSGSDDIERDGLDLSILFDLMKPEGLSNDTLLRSSSSHDKWCSPQADYQKSLIYPDNTVFIRSPGLDLVGDSGDGSRIIFASDSTPALLVSGTEVKDMLPLIAEIYLSRKSVTSMKPSMLVPNYNRRPNRRARTAAHRPSPELEAVKAASVESAEKLKNKMQKRKSNKMAINERDLHSNNVLHACESLLSIMVDKKRNGKSTVLLLKKSGPELPQLLTHFSASIAGTGLAVLFSVACKVAAGRAPLCSSKLASTGLGVGLVWLSWAVNNLRDVVISISRNSSKVGIGENEMMNSLDRSVKAISFRAAALMAVAVLKFV